MEKLYNELKSVWHTYSDETKEKWAMLLGGTKCKSEVMTILSK